MASTLGENIDDYVEQRSESAFKQGVAEGVERGIEKGIEKGLKRGVEKGIEESLERELRRDRAMLSRLAARKFDAETAARFAALLEGIDDPERFADIGEDLMDCATGAELLARVEGAAGRA